MLELTLQRGRLSVGILPSMGAAISYFKSLTDAGEVHWMRPWVDKGHGPLDTASFATVPFFSWLERDRFEFGTRSANLQPSGLGFDRCLLGLGWTSEWIVEETQKHRIVLSHSNSGGPWPWAYSCQQTIALHDDGLSIELALRNDDHEPMPAGLGLHPYFPWPESVAASTSALHVMSDEGLPVAADPDHEAVVSMRDGGPLIGGLDNLFERWDGRATLGWSGRKLMIEASEAYAFLCVNSTSADRSYCCIEPVSHTTNAIHCPRVPWGETGFRLLGAGDTMVATARFIPTLS